MKYKYHPCSKEFQDEAKRLGLNGSQYIQKLVEEGKLPNPTDIDRMTNENIFQRIGYKNTAEYLREWRYKNEIQQSMSKNKDCAHYLGTHIAERMYGRMILPEMYRSIEKEMPYGYPGYDFIVANNIKIDIKSCCLRKCHGWTGWEPHVRSLVADYFVILAFDDRLNLKLMHIWSIGKNDIIRGYEFYMRDSIKITNTLRGLLEFKRFDWIDKLQSLVDEIRVQ